MAYMRGAYNQKSLYREDGSYNFKQREDWDYKHGYNFMCGWLGQEEAKEQMKKKKKKGTVDEVAPPIPLNAVLVETIEKVAKHVNDSKEPSLFENTIRQKNKDKEGWAFLDGGEGSEYYKFCLHCAEREVDPRPLAKQSRVVQEDRERKQANAKANVMSAPAASSEAAPEREAAFKPGEIMEVLGVKSKPDYNGKMVKVMSYDKASARYEVRFEGGRYDSVVVKLREENLMHSSLAERDPEKDREMAEGEIPNGVRVEIRGLQSESARWMNGQKGVVVCWDKELERYEVRLDYNNDIKKVKPANLHIELPPDWEEHWDDHLHRYYYLNEKTQKVTWKHPKAQTFRGKMGKVRENNVTEWAEAEVDIDKDRVHYEVDDEEEGEGGFNLMELVRKVEEVEVKREAAEEAGEEYVDSDDGMYSVNKQKKKKRKKEKIDIDEIQKRLVALMEHTMVGRATMKKDFTLLEGHFIAVKEIDPIIKKLEHACTVGYPPEELMKAAFENCIAGMDKACGFVVQLKFSKLLLAEFHKRVNRITTITTPQELLEDIKWVSTFLKTT
eukprot:TRINITY_DN13890_c0_g2_i1.p1 TRINITY_DN13890_c0_g2~~TRINITY_DN13890_c0_g2_i1.p1  ORF type:complete len:588 (+),score=177.75 TRINITY_DN13890_c0_g2_i1:99-1766(+)